MKFFNGNFDTRDIIAIALVIAVIGLSFMEMDIKVIGTLTASVVSFYFKDLDKQK